MIPRDAFQDADHARRLGAREGARRAGDLICVKAPGGLWLQINRVPEDRGAREGNPCCCLLFLAG